MITLEIMMRGDPQQWEAYAWERYSNKRYEVEDEVNWEKSADYIYNCAELFEIQTPKFYFLQEKDARMTEALGTAKHDSRVNLRSDANWTVAIHEMAHIIQANYMKDRDKRSAKGDWSPHGAIFCGILAVLYEDFGLWPKVSHWTQYEASHWTQYEVNEGHKDPDFNYMRREELWELGILPPKDLSFESTMTYWFKQHNRIGRVNRRIGAGIQGMFEVMVSHNEDPYWVKAREMGATEPSNLFADELDDDEFLEMLLNPAHGYDLGLRQGYHPSREGKEVLLRKIKKEGIKVFLDGCRQMVIDEAIGTYNDYLHYNYPDVIQEVHCDSFDEELEETEHEDMRHHLERQRRQRACLLP